MKERWQYRSLVDTSEWICRLTHSPFSHVDLVLPEGLLGASDSKYAPVVSGNPRGVAIRPVNYQRFAHRRDAAVRATAKQKQLFETFCRAQLGKPFDTDALRPSVFLSDNIESRDWRTPDKWFCAELMARAVEESGVLGYPIPGVKNRVTPADLLLIIAPLIDLEYARQPIPGLTPGPGEI